MNKSRLSPFSSGDFEDQLLLAQDELRQRQIQQENETAEAGFQILSKHPAWNDIQAKLSALNEAVLKRSFSGDVHQERKWAFKVFDKKARLYLHTVSDTESADAFCRILPVISRVAFWDCRLGQPQYCTPVSGEAVSFEREVALHSELAKARAYERASQQQKLDAQAQENKQMENTNDTQPASSKGVYPKDGGGAQDPFDTFQLPLELARLLSEHEQLTLKDKTLEIHVQLKKRDPELEDRRREGYHLSLLFDAIAIRLQQQPNFKEDLVPNVIPDLIEQIRSDLSWYPHNAGDLRPYYLAPSITEWRNVGPKLVDHDRGVAHRPENLGGPVRAERDPGRSEVEHENTGLTAAAGNANVESGQELPIDRAAPGPSKGTSSEPAVSTTHGQRQFRKTGEIWFINFDGRTSTLVDRVGIAYIAHLLRSPGRSVSCRELQATVSGDFSVSVTLGEEDKRELNTIDSEAYQVLDATACKQYKERLDFIQDELREAERNNDVGRRERLAAEKKMLIDQLRSAIGFGGRRRNFPDDTERARKAVLKAITDAIKAIGKHDPELAAHLTNSIHTGGSCCYVDNSITWDV